MDPLSFIMPDSAGKQVFYAKKILSTEKLQINVLQIIKNREIYKIKEDYIILIPK